MSSPEDFKPWRADWKFGLILLTAAGAGAGLAYYGEHQVQIFGAVLCILSGCAGLACLRRGFTRARGKAVEARALARLEKLLQPGWQLQRNVMLRRGDLDGMLVDPDGHRYALEIKSQTAVHLRKGGLLTQARLEDGRGDAMGGLFLRQARLQAHEVDAHPVLWFPAARARQMLKELDGCLVVCGNARYLLKCIHRSK